MSAVMTQKTPIYKGANAAGTGRSQALSVAANETIYSDEIYVSSNKTFATVGFRFNVTAGSPNVTVKVRYRLFDDEEGNWGDAITLKAIGVISDSVKFYRLDAELGLNWMPNTPMEYIFIESAGGAAAFTVKGEHSV